MSGSIEIPKAERPNSASPWATLRQLIGLGRAPIDAPPATDETLAGDDTGPLARPAGALGLFPPPQGRHAELFVSERTGDWIRVGCECGRDADHWHAQPN